MFTNRFSKIAVLVLVLALVLVSVGFVIRSASTPNPNHAQGAAEQAQLDRSHTAATKCFYKSVSEFTCPNQSGASIP